MRPRADKFMSVSLKHLSVELEFKPRTSDTTCRCVNHLDTEEVKQQDIGSKKTMINNFNIYFLHFPIACLHTTVTKNVCALY